MKKLVSVSLVLFSLFSCAQNEAPTAFSKATQGEKVTNLDGKELKFSEVLEKHKGKVTVIELWASWCGDCVKAMPKVKEMQAAHPNVDYVFISMDKAFDKWKAGIEKHQLTGDQYWVNDEKGMKGSFGKSIDLDWIPRYMIIDKEGKITIYRAIETDFEKLNATLKSLE
ncbi:MAG: hypothetical protein RLZZ500_2526 [Bacteroidota bacterium]|jgi:thiol-disulfide isomerase/thioredoxin